MHTHPPALRHCPRPCRRLPVQGCQGHKLCVHGKQAAGPQRLLGQNVQGLELVGRQLGLQEWGVEGGSLGWTGVGGGPVRGVPQEGPMTIWLLALVSLR